MFTVATPKTHQYPFGSLKSPLLRQSLRRIQGACGPVTVGCFCHLSPVKLTSASSTDNCWPPHVARDPEGFCAPCTLMAPVYAVHQCLPKPSTSEPDVPDRRIHTDRYKQSSLLSSWPKPGTLYSCSWSEYSLSEPFSARPEVPSAGLMEVISVLLCLGDC